ncbi:MAG: long-chain fatty acid--CoA ligase [Fibrobacter sp.]|nr:long-chain fatty acid--CoA ligase [Fibrobacter sp.]
MEPLQYFSLPQMFFANCEREDFGGWFHRKKGAWVHFSRQDLRLKTFYLALALKKRGLLPGQSVGIVANSCPEWIMADVATQLNHAVTVPLFPNISSENFNFQCDDSNVQILVLNNVDELDEQLQKCLPRFKAVICIDPESRLAPNAVYWNELLKEGAEVAHDPTSSKWLENQLLEIKPDHIFSIIYTSGSTGRPKGAELSHRNILCQLRVLRQDYIRLYKKNDVCLVVLPVAHVFERMAVYYYILNGTTVYFADNPKNAADIIKEVRPTFMTVVPRILERIYESMTAAGERCKGVQKIVIERAIRLAKTEDPEKPPSLAKKFYDKLVFSKMRDAIGGRFRIIVSGGGALNKTICRFLLNVGITVCEGYGLPECAPVVSANKSYYVRPGSVGLPLPHLEVKIGDNSEVLVKGDSVFRGYHNCPQLNKEIFTEDGYLKTGDQGSFDGDGYLYLTGRIKELLKTSTGKYVSPNPIELELSRHSIIEQALVIANNRKFVSALIFLNPVNSKRLLNQSSQEFDFGKSKDNPRIREAILRHITRINKKLNHWEQIRKWTLVTQELTVESGLLTPTLKIRRKATEEKYSQLIEAMYEQKTPDV